MSRNFGSVGFCISGHWNYFLRLLTANAGFRLCHIDHLLFCLPAKNAWQPKRGDAQ